MAVVINGTTGVTTPGLDASGTNKFATTIGVGGATPSASGAGITFPATQSASSDANTLDDYEEGTWTPTLGGGDTDPSSASYLTQTGKYTKIGNMVTCWLRLGVSSFTGGSGAALVRGLPFTTASGINNAVGAAYNNTDFPAGTVSASIELASSATFIYWSLYTIDNGTFGNVTLTALAEGAEVRVILSYPV
jgi:hypothetical protein